MKEKTMKYIDEFLKME